MDDHAETMTNLAAWPGMRAVHSGGVEEPGPGVRSEGTGAGQAVEEQGDTGEANWPYEARFQVIGYGGYGLYTRARMSKQANQ